MHRCCNGFDFSVRVCVDKLYYVGVSNEYVE